MISGKKIIVGVSASISAYKAIILVRLLVKSGNEVKVILTPSSLDFVSPLVFSTLSKNDVLIEMSNDQSWSNHVELGRWADLMIIAPATCNTIAKMACGICDNLLLAIYLSAICPIAIAPAMDEDMWKHSSTKKNLETLSQFGVQIIPVEYGELASGIIGEGRLAEPERILQFITEFYFRNSLFHGKKVLITAGPTYESIDPVRFIGNHSSGKMGFALADELYLNGAEIQLVTGPTKQKTAYTGIKITSVTSSDEMFAFCSEEVVNADIIIMSAAVADYKPAVTYIEKVKKKDEVILLELTKTKDILKELALKKRSNQFFVGFALETNDELHNAKKKLSEKNLDCIILNSLNDSGAGFGFDTNKITLLDSSGCEFHFDLKSKKEVAKDIVSYLNEKLNG